MKNREELRQKGAIAVEKRYITKKGKLTFSGS
jgi:hypothetical protein